MSSLRDNLADAFLPESVSDPWNGPSPRGSRNTKRRSPSWRSAQPPSPRARHASSSGWSSTRLYTAGTSAQAADLVDPDRFPVHKTGQGRAVHLSQSRAARGLCHAGSQAPEPGPSPLRGGPGAWLIRTLDAFNIRGERRDERVGVWVGGDEGESTEDKIAAIESASAGG